MSMRVSILNGVALLAAMIAVPAAVDAQSRVQVRGTSGGDAWIGITFEEALAP